MLVETLLDLLKRSQRLVLHRRQMCEEHPLALRLCRLPRFWLVLLAALCRRRDIVHLDGLRPVLLDRDDDLLCVYFHAVLLKRRLAGTNVH